MLFIQYYVKAKMLFIQYYLKYTVPVKADTFSETACLRRFWTNFGSPESTLPSKAFCMAEVWRLPAGKHRFDW